MNKKEVLVVGELNVDILLNQVHGFPVVGQEILADQMTLTLGSSSAIFAANLASLGTGVSFCGIVGNDLFGTFIVEQLTDKGVDTSFVIKSGAYQTGLTMILNYDQDRANVTHCGAMEQLTISDVPLDKLAQFKHLHLSSFFLQKGLQKDIILLFKTAHELGLSTSLDIQWDPANTWDFPYEECLSYIDFFLPNETELLNLTGTKLLGDAFTMLDAFANTIIVKRGVDGAIAYSNRNYTHASPYLHTQFVDAIGAGDSFNAGFIYSFLQGKSLQESLLFGNLAGAVNTTAAGGTAAFFNLDGFNEKAKVIFNIDI